MPKSARLGSQVTLNLTNKNAKKQKLNYTHIISVHAQLVCPLGGGVFFSTSHFSLQALGEFPTVAGFWVTRRVLADARRGFNGRRKRGVEERRQVVLSEFGALLCSLEVVVALLTRRVPLDIFGCNLTVRDSSEFAM